MQNAIQTLRIEIALRPKMNAAKTNVAIRNARTVATSHPDKNK